MLFVTTSFGLTYLFSFIISFQINLDSTHWINENEKDMISQHDCFHVAASFQNNKFTTLPGWTPVFRFSDYQIISYCMSEWPSKWNIQQNNLDQKFSFADLYKKNITSEQLYLWSASIDIVELYQLYLNKLSATSHDSSLMETLFFYNCTTPYFGPQCQYSLDAYEINHESLYELIQNFYLNNEYKPKNLTCYVHLECKSRSKSTCLDWTDICDGIVDCVDGVDERDCWQLDINECEADEYRCFNGQCISNLFFNEFVGTEDCLDVYDDKMLRDQYPSDNVRSEPTLKTEDIACSKRYSIGNDRRGLRVSSSCMLSRELLALLNMFRDRSKLKSANCWFIMICRFSPMNMPASTCAEACEGNTCTKFIEKYCPDTEIYPSIPILFGHIYFIHTKTYLKKYTNNYTPNYVCYDNILCGKLNLNGTVLSIGNMTCRHFKDIPSAPYQLYAKTWQNKFILPIYLAFSQCNTLILLNNSIICNNSMMYRCMNSSKCISKYRLCDNTKDCDYGDDENCTANGYLCSRYKEILHTCDINTKCVLRRRTDNPMCLCILEPHSRYDCGWGYFNVVYSIAEVSFTTICDGFNETGLELVDRADEGDETNCEYWQCNNTYTRCDGYWNCLNGADEIDCDSSPLFTCPSRHHLCVSPITNQFMCLPLIKANDQIIDCLGGIDEPQLCRSEFPMTFITHTFHCMNSTSTHCVDPEFCYERECDNGVDMQFCTRQNRTLTRSVCDKRFVSVRSDIEEFFCKQKRNVDKPRFVPFSLNRHETLNEQTAIDNINENLSSNAISNQEIRRADLLRCHRGLPLHVWLNSKTNMTTTTCLCPPSYYGNICQYQNQRISLKMVLNTSLDSWRTTFILVILLIDDSNERNIHSHQQLLYLYNYNCLTRFNINLLYSTRPKNETKQYSIHIDFYEQTGLKYRASILIPIEFCFLPVNRIAVNFHIPITSYTSEKCSDKLCVHGQCIKYSNDPRNTSFCRCNQEWSGKYCNISLKCTCSSDSICIGILPGHRSICVCPIDKWGPQCLLRSLVCQNSTNNYSCYNGGQCIPFYEHVVSTKNFLCICSKGYHGERCELTDTKLILSFHKDIILPSSIRIHFVQTMKNATPTIGSTYKLIPIIENSVIVHWSYPFHIAFVQLFENNYYIITVQKQSIQSQIINRTLNPSDRCKYVTELFNETIANSDLLRRIKYYHVPCQNYSSSLSCFYDIDHFCLCTDFGNQRLANCFKFNYTETYDCSGTRTCENGGQCLQNSPICPQTSVCLCPSCYYGTQCQFSSHTFGISLDAIIGIYIRPNIGITNQPEIVQFSLAFTIILAIAGFINSTLCWMTFKTKVIRETGCGTYLLTSSIITLIIMIFFILKFSILLTSQMSYKINRTFLKLECHLIDSILQISLGMDQWLNACVAMERGFAAFQGVKFNVKKNKKLSYYVVIVMLLFTIAINIHDPIHRRLIDDDTDDEEKRTWCIVTYSSALQTYTIVINIFQFIVPFLMNLISIITLIISTAKLRSNARKEQSYQNILYQEIKQHMNLLIAPIVLIILALPRLIISLLTGCMKSRNDSLLLLIGYFISFIPSILTFIVYVLPSKMYKQQFRKTVQQYQQMIRNRLRSSL